MHKNRRMMLLLIIGAIVLSPLIVMAIYVDDWSRDLSNNRAATSASNQKNSLRPLAVSAESAEVTAAVLALCEENASWSLGDAAELPDDSALSAELSEPPVAAWSLIHATGLLGFRDDVWLVAEPTEQPEGALLLHAESRSRIGKGDLGQNPRNLRELLGWLRERLPTVTP